MIRITIAVLSFFSLFACGSVEVREVLQPGDPEITGGSVVFGGLDGNLYATSGSEQIVQLTDDGGGNESGVAYGAYGWAGDSVVYAVQQVNRDRSLTGSVYAVVPGRRAKKLMSRDGFLPFFLYPTPSGDRVGYLGSISGEPGFLMGSVAVAGGKNVEHGIGQPFYSAWSPDGLSLMTHIGLPFGPEGSAIGIQSVESLIDGEVQDPELELSTGSFQAPAYSPNGEYVAVALNRRGESTVSLITADGSRFTDIAPLSGTAAMAWSPQGGQLAFIDGQYLPSGGIVGSLWISTPETQSLRRVSAQISAFFWSPDGSKILLLEPFFAGSGSQGTLLYRVRIQRMTSEEPDAVGVLRPSEAFVRQIVPFFDQYHRAYTVWSPDSKLVVLNSTRADGTPLIHLLDTERLRTGNQFNVAFGSHAQSRPEDGLVLEDGYVSRVLSFGTNPFFSEGSAEVNLP